MRNFLLILTVALVTMSATFSYSAFYCLNSGESDIANGLIMTFAIPAAIGAFIALCGFAATPVEVADRRTRRQRRA
jgi:hypothetical protein